MKLQYEILSIGLKRSIIAINQEEQVLEEDTRECYYKFSTYFVDDKENLKDVMQQLGQMDEMERIKEELFLLLSFFVLTFEHRGQRIQNIITKNKANFESIINDFSSKVEDEDTKQLLDALT